MRAAVNLGYLVFLSAVAALGGFLFGYDTAVVSGTVTQVSALFGLDAMSSGWYVGCALVGSIGGVAVSGALGDRIGRRGAMGVSAALFTASALGCALSGSLGQLVLWRIVGGVGIGVASVICPLYISELAAAECRGRLVSLYQLAVTVGFVGAYLVNYLIMRDTGGSSDSWRWMLGAETVPAAIFCVVLCRIPESPRHLAARGRTAEASAVVARVYRDPGEARRTVEAVVESLRAAAPVDGADLRLLMRPRMMRGLLIGMAIAILGQFMGVNAVLYYGPVIFEDAGLSGDNALLYQVAVGAVNTLTTVAALMLIDRVGRKRLVYAGVSGMIVSLLLIALYFVRGAEWGVPPVCLLILFMFYIMCCAGSICAVVWVLLSEMYPTRVRAAAMSAAGFALWTGTYLVGQLTPWLLEEATPAGTFMIFAAMCVPYLLLMRYGVPETTGRTLEEIERHWLG